MCHAVADLSVCGKHAGNLSYEPFLGGGSGACSPRMYNIFEPENAISGNVKNRFSKNNLNEIILHLMNGSRPKLGYR